MDTAQFIDMLKQFVPADQVSWVLEAIRQEEFVEQFLQSEKNISLIRKSLGDNPGNWSIGRIAVLSLCESRVFETNTYPDVESVVQWNTERANELFEEVIRGKRKPESLADYALLGIALQKSTHLQGLKTAFDKILHTDLRNLFSLWKTAVVISGDLHQEPLQWVASLFVDFSEPVVWKWGIHWLISQFIPRDKKIQLTVQLLENAPVNVQIEVLQLLIARGFQGWSQKVAGILLTHHPLLSRYRAKVDFDRLSPSAIFQYALSLQQLSMLASIAGNYVLSESILRSAQQAIQHWQIDTTLQHIIFSRKGIDFPKLQGISQKVLSTSHSSRKLKQELANVLVEYPENEQNAILDSFEEYNEPVFILLKAKRQLVLGNHAVALELGRLAVEKLEELIKDAQLDFSDIALSLNWQNIFHDLIALGFTKEAQHFAQALLDIRPTDTQLLHLLSEINLRISEEEKAYQTGKIAYELAPDNSDVCRHFAGLCEKTNRWKEAQSLWKKLLPDSYPSENADLTIYLPYVRSSFYAGDDEIVFQVCQGLITQYPDCGEAHGWAGKALLRLGKEEDGISFLTRATLLAPEDERWWLSLSEYWLAKEDTASALSTLKSAVMAVSDSGSIYYHLGNLLLQLSQTSEALIYLRKASTLYPENPEIALRLCQALHGLGYLQEARRVLENLKGKWTIHPEMAYEHFRIALEQKDELEALESLEIAVKALPSQKDWIFQYVQLLLETASLPESVETLRFEQAEFLLRNVLEHFPKEHQAQLLLGEVLIRNQKFDEASQLFTQLADDKDFLEGSLGWKVYYGLGVISIEKGNYELGVAFLKDAISRQPENPPLLKNYAEACVKAQLFKEAIEAGDLVCKITPNDFENLEWFAQLAIQLNKLPLAIEKYSHLTELFPHRLDWKVTLADLHLKTGAVDQAKAVLDSLVQTESLDAGIFQKAGHLYLKMDNTSGATRSFEKALAVSLQPTSDLLRDLMRVYEVTGRINDALNLGETAIQMGKDTPELSLEYARLLSRAGKDTLAQKTLLQTLSSGESQSNSLLRSEIHKELANICWKQKDLTNGLMYAEMGLLENPQSLPLKYLHINLAVALLQWEKARQLLQSLEVTEQMLNEKDGLQLLLLKGHLSLQDGNFEGVEEILHLLEEAAGDSPEYSLLKARYLSLKGQYNQSKDILNTLPVELGKEWNVWRICAERESLLYSTALSHIREFIQETPDHPWGKLEYIRCVTEGKEISHIGRLLKLKPGGELSPIVDELEWEKAEQMIHQLSGYLNTDDLRGYSIRLKVAFDPTVEHLKLLAGAVRSAHEASCLIQGLRSVGNTQMALQIAHPYEESEAVRFQEALCFVGKDPVRGIDISRQLVEKNPQHPLYQVLFSILAKDVGETELAYQAIGSVISQYSDEPEWQALAAELAVELGKYQEGINHWEKAIALRPERSDYLVELGWAYMLNEAYEDATETLLKASKMDPSNSSIWFNLAQAYKHLSLIDEAISCALRAGEVDPTHIQGFILASELALEMGSSDLARKYAEMAIERDETNPKAVMAIVRVYNYLGKEEQSLSMLETLQGKMPPVLEVDLERASLIYRLRGAQDALPVTQRLVTEFPEDAASLALHARVLADLGEVKLAERFAFRSLRQEPDQPELALSLARMQRSSGQLDQAVHLLTQAITHNPQYVDLYIELGKIYTERREFDLALQTFHHAIRIAPQDPRGYYHTALILRDGKDFAGAEMMLHHAAKLAPDDVVIHRQLVSVMALNLIHKSQEAGASL